MADTKTEKTVADELKTAAAKLREMVKGDPWSVLVHPSVAEPLASWLETEAHMCEQRGNSADGHTFHALAVARVLNRTAP